jgi:SNF2 family DNA or RNA helicase
MYNTLKKEFILEFENKPINKTLYATTKFIWLRQIIGGIISTAPSKHKLDLLAELLQNELHGQRIIIWAVFTDEIKAIVEFLTISKIPAYAITGAVKQADRKAKEKIFKNVAGTVLVIQPECYKFGADLSSADTMIYFSTPTSGMTRRQTEDRGIHLYRKNPLLIIDLLCRKTIDESILENTLAKISDFEKLRSIVQALQND